LRIGGFDKRLKENVNCLRNLQRHCDSLGLSHRIAEGNNLSKKGVKEQVLFWPSVDDKTKNILLQDAHALLYTPANEHFGIVPIEAMAVGTPVIAVNSGGPCETIIDGQSGFLTEGTAASFGKAVLKVPSLRREESMENVEKSFSQGRLGDELEDIIGKLLLAPKKK